MATAIKKLSEPTREDFKRVADSIRKVSTSAKAMKSSGLSRQAILVLINSATGIPQRDIRIVLDAAELLALWCLTQHE